MASVAAHLNAGVILVVTVWRSVKSADPSPTRPVGGKGVAARFTWWPSLLLDSTCVCVGGGG